MPPCRLPARLRCFCTTVKPKRSRSPSWRFHSGPISSPKPMPVSFSQPFAAGSNAGSVFSAEILSFILYLKILSFSQRLANLQDNALGQTVVFTDDLFHLGAGCRVDGEREPGGFVHKCRVPHGRHERLAQCVDA